MKNIMIKEGTTFFKIDQDEWCSIAPKSGIKTTLNDMSKYLLENLNIFDNEYDAADKLIKQFSLRVDVKQQIVKDIDDFIFKMIREGIIICNKKVLFQPYYHYDIKDKVALYFPYLRTAFLINNELYNLLKSATVNSYDDIKRSLGIKELGGVEELLNMLNIPIASDEVEKHYLWEPTRVVLLPTTLCNLRCKYCYAWKEDKQHSSMTTKIAYAGIDYVFQNSIKTGCPSVDISFMGGGEPTCNWKVLVDAVKYAKELAVKNEVPSTTMLTTNGILNDEQIDWLIDNIDFIKISFDGIEKVQNTQRPTISGDSFARVSHTMSRLSRSNIKFLIRITTTNESIIHLKESVNYIINNFSPTSIIINPVYVCGSCASHGVESIDYELVCNEYKSIENLGANKGIDIVIPYDKMTYMDIPKMPYCGFQKGNIFLTPDGYVSACSEIDNTNDDRACIFFFGHWDSETNRLIINKEKLTQLHKISTAENEKCRTCTNNIMCSGPCLTRKLSTNIISTINSLWGNRDIDESFSDEEMLLMINGNHSDESIIQCKMTDILSGIQLERIILMEDTLNDLSLFVSKHNLTKKLNELGVYKIISVHAEKLDE